MTEARARKINISIITENQSWHNGFREPSGRIIRTLEGGGIHYRFL